MKPLFILLIAVCSLAFTACDRPRPHANPWAAASEQLNEQFLAQHATKKTSSPRKLSSARITSFGAPPGNSRAYLGISVIWDTTVTSTSVPLIQLGDGLFGVTYQDPTTKEEYSAVINFR